MKQTTADIAKKISLLTLIAVAALLFVFREQPDWVNAKPQDAYKQLETFSSILSLVEKNYVEEVEIDKAIEGAIRGMLSTLDPHSSYMKPDDFKELQMETRGSFTGIGIEITMKDSILTIVSPIEGTPGFRQGLKAGDKIVKIEDEPTKDLTLMEAVKRLRGPKGTEVNISIHREGWTELKEISIVRDIIPLLSVKSRMLEEGFPYLRISNFQAKTTKDFNKALEEAKDKGKIKGLVLDLRNNPGGLLDQAVKISDIFLNDGVIVSTKGRLANQSMVFNAHDDGENDFPVVVLVNEGSASASEIVAGAPQDHKRAIILGAKTFGKGSVQTVIPMSNGAGLRLTTACYYTPSGISIQAKGITPDIEVASVFTEKKENKEDTKKKRHFAREEDLKNHMENGNAKKEENDSEKTTADSPEKNEKDKVLEKTQEMLERDQQLRTALMLLKGVAVFQGFK